LPGSDAWFLLPGSDALVPMPWFLLPGSDALVPVAFGKSPSMKIFIEGLFFTSILVYKN
jgi:hypothetical protein